MFLLHPVAASPLETMLKALLHSMCSISAGQNCPTA
jgi:hypothetical protein